MLLVACAAFLGRGLAPKVVLAAAAAVFLLAAWRPRFCAALVAAGIVAAAVAFLVVPAHVYRSEGFSEIRWLDSSSRYRIEIWDLAARWTRQRPLLGYGVGASRALPPIAEKSKVHGGWRRIPLYPHNVMVQTALELGLAGLVLMLAICLLMVRALSRLPPPLPAYALAAFVSAAGIWCIGYPLWRSAWLSWLGFAALSVLLAAPDPRPGERECAAS
jgi:O-antigen ligase